MAGELKPGDKCDRYDIVRLIAAGGMGEVYEAVHEFTGRPVALKCLQLRHANKSDLQDRMKMEAVVLCRLRHANIVTVYDAGISDKGMVWIAMDLLVGKTLRELLMAHQRFPAPQALYYACEIADGVDAAHELRVVHRDLKPENVFITDRNEVKVLDLGTAKFYGYGLKTTDRMRTLGTPAYMSPEHIQGTPVDARTDIYALGLIVYEMLAGHHIFAEGPGGELPNSLEMGTAQMFRAPKPLPEIVPGLPDYVWTVVERAIQKDREKRYGSMSQFAGELRAARQRYVAETGAKGGFAAAADGTIAPSRPGARRDYVPPTPAPHHKTVALDVEPRVI